MIDSVEKVIKAYTDVFYVEQTDMIPLVCAVVIQSKMEGDPIWLWLVGGSSAGKTELINAIGGISFVKEISMLTENTFLSGMITKGKEASLLTQIGPTGVLTMRDMTTLFSMNAEKQAAIQSQLRQIFDGYITKATGTGKTLEWRGRLNLVSGITEIVHVQSEKIAASGTRQILYTLAEQNRRKTTRRAMENVSKIKILRQRVQDSFTEYINHMINKIDKNITYEIPENIMNNVEELTDLVALATTGVARDYRGDMQLMLSPNMPMRYAGQAIALAKTFMFMADGKLEDWGERLVYRTCLDSIPKQRLMCLRVLAKYREVTSTGMSISLGYEVDLVNSWLADLDALKICKRITHSEAGRVRWVLKPEYRAIMAKYDGVKYLDEMYTGSEKSQTLDEWMDEGEIEADVVPVEKPKTVEMFKGM